MSTLGTMKTALVALGTVFSIAFASTPTAFAQQKLRMVTSVPAQSFIYQDILKVWAERIGESSANSLEIEVFPTGTLGRDPQTHLDMVRDGVADIGYIIPGYTPGAFPEVTVIELPTVVPSATVGSRAGAQMVEEGLFRGSGTENLVVLGMFSTAPTQLTTTRKVASLEEIRGLKLRGAGPALLGTIEALGAVPVGGLTVTNIAESISRGLIDGSINEWVAMTIFGIADVTKFHLTGPNLGASPIMVVMNRVKYENLSPEQRAAIDENSGLAFSNLWGETFDSNIEKFRSAARNDSQRTFTELTPEEEARWNERLQSVIEKWIANTPNGQTVFDRYSAAIQTAAQ
jgi:TRAP-type C4-dicarboxylate transport system substrate-binding protein